MFAEAVAADPDNNSANDVALAYEYVNRVRRRGFGLDVYQESGVDLEDEGKDALLAIVKEERARELGYELTRKDDLVRWNEFYPRMKEVQMQIPFSSASYITSADLYFGNVETRDELWPIPSHEIGINHALVQNQGW